MTRQRPYVIAIPILVLLVGLTATFAIWNTLQKEVARSESQRFSRISDRVVQSIEDRLRNLEGLLEGGRGLFYAHPEASTSDWQMFANTQHLKLYPGALGFGYVVPVPRPEQARFLAHTRKATPDFTIKTEGDYPTLFIIRQVEPRSANQAAWGLDIAQERFRREAALESAISNRAVLTKRITLVQDKKKTAGFLMLLPIYRTPVTPPTAPERLAQLQGWVYVPIRIDELMAGVTDDIHNLLDFEIFGDNPDASQNLIYDDDLHLSKESGTPHRNTRLSERNFSKSIEIDTQGRHWIIQTSTLPSFESQTPSTFWPLPIGLSLTLLGTLSSWLLLNARDRAERLASAMSQEARNSESQMRAIVDSAMDAIIVIDPKGRITRFNPAAETIFGYSANEILNQNIRHLLPEPFRGMEAIDPRTGLLGQILSTTGHRSEGRFFPAEMTMTRVAIPDQVLFTCVIRDMTEQKKVDRMKHEFVSTVSHELRTPLTAIRGSLGLMAGGAAGELPENIKTLITLAYSNSDRLLRLINDLLDMERITSGGLALSISPQAIAPLLTQAVQENETYAKQHGVTLRLDETPPPDIAVSADHFRLLQVLANLLSNAAKFSQPGGSIWLSADYDDTSVTLVVRDEGIGIDDTLREKVFERFVQGDSSDTRQKGGTGLGLAISKTLVQQMQGSIDFNSIPGQGTTFRVTLPRTTQPRHH